MERIEGMSEVKLSQCMIVKNEEKNIERALCWAKAHVMEQIVVDTGSTDRTVELAAKMGAKIYRFDWINDFSAAKNYALDQAAGDWSIFTDADEYMTSEDADKLIKYLKNIQNDPEKRKNCLALNCRLVNMDDEGKAISVHDAMRVFRNETGLRFTGRIHERLDVQADNVVWADEFEIYHTGYSDSEKKEKNKTKRNIDMLREEIAFEPDDMALKVYLADALKQKDDEESQNEADSYFMDVIENGAGKVFYKLRVKAYIHFMNKYVNDPEKRDICEALCKRALTEFPGSLDFEYFLASVLNYRGEYRAAWELLKAGEDKLKSGADCGVSFYVIADRTMLYGQMLLAAQGLGDLENVAVYAALILLADKTKMEILTPLIAILSNAGLPADEVLCTLADIYNLKDAEDLLIIARAAKDCGALGLANKTMTIARQHM